MWPFFWLNLGLAVAVVAVLVWAVRRIERGNASFRDEVLAVVRAELTRPTAPAPPPVAELPTPPPVPPADDWTPAKNARRVELIDREIDEVITPEEAKELEGLQTEVDRYIDRVAPRPLEYARELHRQLLEKAAKANKP
jgi:hypothetical protein